jgi:inner membrane protein
MLKNNPHLTRFAILGLVTLILLLPTSMIRGLIGERQDRHHSAAEEITSKWGDSQWLIGPALVLPYTIRSGDKITAHDAIFLPKRLNISGVVTTEKRGRGIFEVPVYSFSGTIEGEFEKPKLETLNIDPTSVEWSKAHLAMGISDVRALRSQPTVSWNGMPSEFLPGTGGFKEDQHGLHAQVVVTPVNNGFKFSFPLAVNGSHALFVSPFGDETVLQLRSNWPAPNFQGNWLPTDRTITKDGFDATWRVSYLGRNYPQSWVSPLAPAVDKALIDSLFGVNLNDPIDHYRMADRSVKYASLFILLTFTSIWLLEVLAKATVHPIQYLMLGAALCVFYLLELSLSEHIAFSIAYGIASVAIIVMIGTYGRVLFRRGERGFVVPAGVALLYSYLYVLLTNEDAALLVGSIGLFAILAVVMFLTRGVNWYAAIEQTRPARPQE